MTLKILLEHTHRASATSSTSPADSTTRNAKQLRISAGTRQLQQRICLVFPKLRIITVNVRSRTSGAFPDSTYLRARRIISYAYCSLFVLSSSSGACSSKTCGEIGSFRCSSGNNSAMPNRQVDHLHNNLYNL